VNLFVIVPTEVCEERLSIEVKEIEVVRLGRTLGWRILVTEGTHIHFVL
jgi:hypothetical protein